MKRLLSLSLLFIFTLAFEPGVVWADEPTAASSKTYTLFASGDTQLGRWTPWNIYERGAKWALEDVADLIREADIAMTNLECVVATTGAPADKGERRPFFYRAPPDMLDVLTTVGFDVVTTANNHAGDFGPEALMEQRALLQEVGIAPVGCGRNMSEASHPVFVQVDDVIVAFIGLETRFHQFAATKDRPGIHHAKKTSMIIDRLEAAIEKSRGFADLIVFSPHWKKNWTENPGEEELEVSRRAIDLGADAVLGHSSHHLHGIENYRGHPIVYDMGTFYFDTVGQKRMRLSAGFVLHFTKAGFSRLDIVPMVLKRARTVRARGRELATIKELLIGLSKEFAPIGALKDLGDKLTLQFQPEEVHRPRGQTPPKVHTTGQTRTLSGESRSRKSNVVVAQAPNWTAGFAPVAMQKGVTLLGAQTAEAVRPGYGFMAEVALKVSGPLKGARWDAVIKGVREDGADKFEWRHAVADGSWVPQVWEAGQTVIDRTLVRSTKVQEGRYRLFYRLVNTTYRTFAGPIEPQNHAENGFVEIGSVLIQKSGIPKGPAGVAWSGKLSDLKQSSRSWILAALIGGGLFFAALAFVFAIVVRRRRRSSGSQ